MVKMYVHEIKRVGGKETVQQCRAPISNDYSPSKYVGKVGLRDCGKLDEDRPRLRQWAEGPNVFLVQGVASSLKA